MTKRFTLTLGICVAAAGFTAASLFVHPPPSASDSPAYRDDTPSYGVDTPAGTDDPSSGGITIEGFKFTASPVSAGSTVTVDNRDGAPHTVTGDAFNVGLDPKASGTFVAPSEPGTYSFTCLVHPSMKGELVVE